MKKSKQQKQQVDANQIKYKYSLVFNEDDEGNEFILIVKCKYFKFEIYWYCDKPYESYLSGVRVKEKYRQKGYGNILLNKVFEIVQEKEFKQMYLKVEDYSWKRKWYERNGFKFHEYVPLSRCPIDWVWLVKDF